MPMEVRLPTLLAAKVVFAPNLKGLFKCGWFLNVLRA